MNQRTWNEFVQINVTVSLVFLCFFLRIRYRSSFQTCEIPTVQSTQHICSCKFTELVSNLFGVWIFTALCYAFARVNRLNIITSRSKYNDRNSLKMYFFFFSYPFPDSHTNTHNQWIDLIIIPVICEQQLKWCCYKEVNRSNICSVVSQWGKRNTI